MALEIIDVGGVTVRVDHHAPGAASALLGGLPRRDGPPAVRIVVGGDVPPPPPRPCDLEARGLQAWWDDGVVALAVGSCRALITDGLATIAAGDGWAARHLLQLALMHLLAPHGRFVLHAAAVAARGRAWLVTGGTGAGKSTVAAGALASGWDVLADDLVVVRQGEAGPEVTGIPRPMAVPADLGLVGPRVEGDPRQRVLVEASRATGWFPVAGVVVAAHGDDQGGLSTLPGVRTVPVLVGSSFLVGDRARLAGFFPCLATLARLPAYTLALARDPRARLERVGSCLSRLFGA